MSLASPFVCFWFLPHICPFLFAADCGVFPASSCSLVFALVGFGARVPHQPGDTMMTMVDHDHSSFSAGQKHSIIDNQSGS